MLQQLINHSPDIKKLIDEGFQLEVKGAYLLTHHIPYVTLERRVKYGTIVTVLTLAAPDQVGQPADHTVFFQGEKPCEANGQPLHAIINSSGNQQLNPDILINHYFSSKPAEGKYADYYQKIRTYAEILSVQARLIDPVATARPMRVIPPVREKESVFTYPDTNAARSRIDFLNDKFANLKVAIVGLGGTGSYILDLLAKTPVREIHLFDGDTFQVHNAFRAPGALGKEQLRAGEPILKVNYFHSIYSQMHKGVVPHSIFLDDENVARLKGLDHVFLAVDSNKVRQLILEKLKDWNIPFIDVGIGVNIVDDSLVGAIRVTAAAGLSQGHVKNRIGQDEHEINEYAPNIQIADLNCLNAVLAVVKWKKQLGFYQDLKKEQSIFYFVNTNKLINDDFAA